MLAEREIAAFVAKLRRALTGADEFPDRWARLRQRWASGHQQQPHCGADLQEAYEKATGALVVCD